MRPEQRAPFRLTVVVLAAVRSLFAFPLSIVERVPHRRIRHLSATRISRMGFGRHTSHDVRLDPNIFEELTLVLFLRHSVHALGVTSPSPRRLFELLSSMVNAVSCRCAFWRKGVFLYSSGSPGYDVGGASGRFGRVNPGYF
jgi:hypothetical protein